jgi:Protein of unknown function (DUF3300)
MTYRKAPLALACIAASLLAQACVQYVPEGEYPPPPPPQPPPYPAPPAASQPAPAQDYREVDALMAPIALYPDPLIAIMLPASTLPSEIAAASSYLVQYGDMTRIDSQPWDPSVRALAHYPTVIAWMAQNIAWTEAVGSEFASSPAEAMDSIQRLRARAWAAGTLSSTPQQEVFSDDGAIDILPAQPDELFVPAYDPDVVYPDEPYYGYGGPFMYFGSPFPAGIWLDYAFDWHRHRVWSGFRGRWHDHGGWRAPHFDGDQPPEGARSWHPRHGSPGDAGQGRGAVRAAAPVPRAMPGAPKPPPAHMRSTLPRPAQPAPAFAPGKPAQAGAAGPKDRPRLGAPTAQEEPARQAGSTTANGNTRPPGAEARGSAPLGPGGAVRAGNAPAPMRPAPPPAPGSRDMRAPAQAPARTPSAPSVAHAAPAPAAAPAPSSSSSSSGTNQPQK